MDFDDFWEFDDVESASKEEDAPALFRGIIDKARESVRKSFSEEVKKKYTRSLAERDFETELSRATLTKFDTEDMFKQKDSIIQEYQNFVAYKRQKQARKRIKEYGEIAQNILDSTIDPKYYSFTEGERWTPKEENLRRRYSFPESTSLDIDIEQRENFDDILNLSQIIKEGTKINWKEPLPEKYVSFSTKDTPEEKTKTEEAHESDMELLVKDNYYPGFLDDSINGKVDFNQIVFDISFGSDGVPIQEPENPPISLCEAFDLRIELETGAKRKTTTKKKDSFQNLPEELQRRSFISFLQEKQSKTKLISRDEVVLANAVQIDISTLARNKPVNEITQAINCLQRAVLMNDYDVSLRAAEKAYEKAPPEFAEIAAVYGARGFEFGSITEKKAAFGGTSTSYMPIEVISYMGITKPIYDNDL